MIIEFSVYDTPYFSIEHLLDSEENRFLINDFMVMNDAGGLEDYLKYQAEYDELNNNSRTYLVKDVITGEFIVYLCFARSKTYSTLSENGIFTLA